MADDVDDDSDDEICSGAPWLSSLELPLVTENTSELRSLLMLDIMEMVFDRG